MSESTAEDVAAAQAAEYGKYVAKEAIYAGTALLANEGDPVAAGHVDGYSRKNAQGETEKIAPVVRKEQVRAVKQATAATKES